MNREEVFGYVKKKYGTTPEYPWHEYPHYVVLRHTDDAKWYGLIMDVPKNRLGLEGTGTVDVIDVKANPDEIGALQKTEGILPAYHMNKEHWVSAVLSNVPEELILKLLDESYQLTEPHAKKGKKEVLKK